MLLLHIFVLLLLFRQVYADKEELPQYVEALDSVNREYYPSQQVGLSIFIFNMLTIISKGFLRLSIFISKVFSCCQLSHVQARQREMIKSYTTGAYSQTYNAYQQVIVISHRCQVTHLVC